MKRLVLFGITGDLSKKKLIPALRSLFERELLKLVQVTGFGRSPISTDELDTLIGTKDSFRSIFSYVSGDYHNISAYKQLLYELKSDDELVVYISTPPFVYSDIIEGLLSIKKIHAKTRVYFEKPFGLSKVEAEKLFSKLEQEFITEGVEQNAFVIDHYVAKPSFQNLIKVRKDTSQFSNWFSTQSDQSEKLSNITLDIKEDSTAEKRGSLYDASGVLKDVVQNHMLQMLKISLISFSGQNNDDKSFCRFLKQINISSMVRAQYNGFKTTKGVSPDSQTETYVKINLEYTNTNSIEPVSIVMEAGKALKKGDSSIKIKTVSGRDIVTTLSGHENISIDGKLVWEKEARKEHTPDAYEVIFSSALDDKRDVFIPKDEVLASWQFVETLIQHMQQSSLLTYEVGSDTVNT